MLDKHNQLCSFDYEAIKQFCNTQPASTNPMVQHFIKWAVTRKQKRICKNRSSYGLKHDVETLSDLLNDHTYVSNTELIIAMVKAGFELKNTDDHSENYRNAGPNYYFNLKKFDDKDLAKLADSIDGGARLTPDMERARKNQERRWAYRYSKAAEEYFKHLNTKDDIKKLDMFTGKNYCFDISLNAEASRVLKLYNQFALEDYRIEHLRRTPVNDDIWSEWVQDTGKFNGATGRRGNNTLTISHDDFCVQYVFRNCAKRRKYKNMITVPEETVDGVYVHLRTYADGTLLQQWITATTLKQNGMPAEEV